jgi:uncharacterized membrane protein YphA (DoxX/SURF4 family)
MRLAGVGHVAFAVTLVGIGLWGLVTGGFGAIWTGVPKALPGREAVAYLCAVVSLAAGAGLFWRRTAAPAARLLLAYLIVWFVALKIPAIAHAPLVEVSWEEPAETLVVLAAAWALYAWVADDWDRRRLGFAVGEPGTRIARILYGLAMIPFGLAHVFYVKETAALVPGWLPAHAVWAYATGGAYVAAGVAILTGVLGRLAAALSTLQMGGFTLLVWVPILASGTKDPFNWSEGVISLTLTAAGLVIAETYRGRPWLALRPR